MQYTYRITGALKLTVLAAALSALAACGHQKPLAEAPAAEAGQPRSGASLRPQANQPSGTAAPQGTAQTQSPESRMIHAYFGALDGPDAGTGIVRLTLADSHTEGEALDTGSDPFPYQNAGVPQTERGGTPVPASENAAEGSRADIRLLENGVDTVSIISDEQDFEAVSRRESIESDARRLVEQRASRVDFEPEALPERQGSASVAQYALNFSNDVGNKVYGRFGSFLTQHSLSQRCAEFGGDYAAQQAFLDAGGPQKDKLLLDPDGDGFACGWTPDIYRSMIN